MVQKRRERTLRGGLAAPLPEASTAFGPLGAAASGPTGRRGRDRVIALGAVATLATVAGIASWRLIEADPAARWATQTQAQIGSLDQQLTLLAQTTRQWQTQPPEVIGRRPDVAVLLLQREQELTQEKADLTVELARYQQLPALRAREAAADAQAQALLRRLDAPSVAADPDAHGQLMAQLAAVREQRERDALAARTAADAVAAAKTKELPDDSAKTRGVLAMVTSLINRSATPAPAVPPNVQVEAAGPPTPDLAPGAFAAAGGQPPATPDAPAPAIPPPPAATTPNAAAGMPIAPAHPSPLPAPLSPPVVGPARSLPATPTSHLPSTSTAQVPVLEHPETHTAPPRIGAHDNGDAPDNAARDNAARDNAAPAGASLSHPHVVVQGTAPAPVAKEDRGAADDRLSPALDQPTPSAQQQPPVADQPAPVLEQPTPAQVIPETRPAQSSPLVQATSQPSQRQRSADDQPRSLPATLPRTQVPASASQTHYQPRAASTPESLPTEDQVKEWTGDKEIARQSQTPEGKALMRSLLGGDGGDPSTATDRSSVRYDPSRSDESGDSSSTATTGRDHSNSHKSHMASDSATNSSARRRSASSEDSGNAEGGTASDSESTSGSDGQARHSEHSTKKSSGEKPHSSSDVSSSDVSSSDGSSSSDSFSSKSSSDDSD